MADHGLSDTPEHTHQQNEFQRLLRWLGASPDTAGESYLRLREKLILFLDKQGCVIPDELADRTLDRVARRLAEGEIIQAENPHVYCYGVARLVLKEYWRSKDRASVPIDETSLGQYLVNKQLESQERQILELRLSCLKECLERQSEEARLLLQEYYHGDWHAQVRQRKRLSRRLGISAVALRGRVPRLRAALAKCVKACTERKENTGNTLA